MPILWFLRWLTIFFGFGEVKKLSVSSVKAYSSMLSAVFRFKLRKLSNNHVMRDLIRCFAIERSHRPQLPPAWDLDVVLRHLMSAAYEPLESLSLWPLTEKTLFLVALATSKRVGQLQAPSWTVSSVVGDMVVSYLLIS